MLRFAGLSKLSSYIYSVVLQNFQFRMHHDTQALAEAVLAVQFPADSVGMQALYSIVVGGDEGLFAREVVVGSAGGDLRRARDVAHGGDLEAATAKKV